MIIKKRYGLACRIRNELLCLGKLDRLLQWPKSLRFCKIVNVEPFTQNGCKIVDIETAIF